jgi:hypothetical protein
MLGDLFLETRKRVSNFLFRRRLSKSPFYRAYPYTGKLSLALANNRGVVDTGLRFFYNDMPKTGSSTVIATLAKLKGYGDHLTRVEAKDLFKTPADLSPAEVKDIPRYYTFVFVRNPYSRVLSAYLDKVVGNRAYLTTRLRKTPLARAYRERGTVPSFAEFLSYLEHGGLYADGHWAPQTSLLLLPIALYDFIGKLKDIDDDLPEALSHIFPGAEVSEKDLRVYTPHSTNSNKIWEGYYTPELRKVVQRLYPEDFEAFGYPS